MAIAIIIYDKRILLETGLVKQFILLDFDMCSVYLNKGVFILLTKIIIGNEYPGIKG
jgi:hypothetical protein